MENIKALQNTATRLRVKSLKATTAAGSGHPTSCLSAADLLSCLFFSVFKKEDEFILSKGHAAPLLYAVYAESGVIKEKELLNLRKITSKLEGHPTPLMPFVKVATGSLGQGLSIGVGMALAKKLEKKKGKIYVLLGDGECAEGSIWEAANLASYYQVNNLCAIVDVNRLGQSQQTMHGHHLQMYEKKFQSFGWSTKIIDGHHIPSILKALHHAKSAKNPLVILAKTKKGKGISFLEDKENWHGKALSEEELTRALRELPFEKGKLRAQILSKKINYSFIDFKRNKYPQNERVSTREAFGKALIPLGEKNKKIIVLDGDVKNSTRTEYFFEAFSQRSFQTFIAEQNMVGMAIGFSTQGFISIVSTFAAFLTRAHDFIRMAAYSKANIKFVGSHAGVHVGEDGPSQMGLEDIAMFLSVPHAVILYPCDAVATEYCTREMTKQKGIFYLRTTRGKTPILYKNNEKFPIGKLKVLKKSRKDAALIVAAGITVHEALKAYEILAKKNIFVRVIDLYSLQPVDKKELSRNARECQNKVIVVEDHYLNGIGSVVASVVGKITHLYVKDIPRSGKPEELLQKYGIDASAIMKVVEKNSF